MIRCSIDGCVGQVYVKSRGWCQTHYGRWHKHGDPLWVPRRERPEAERFWAYVDVGHPLGCWVWTGGHSGSGYGVFATGSRVDDSLRFVLAHRYAYVQLIGEIPDGMQLDHLCRYTSCVNPDHLEPVTPRENSLRGVGPSAKNARATHCKNGHPFTPENTWLNEKRNARHCRTCSRRRFREWAARSKERAA